MSKKFWCRLLSMITCISLAAFALIVYASPIFIQSSESEPEVYNHQYSRTQGVNNFYYVYAPYNAQENRIDYSLKSEMELVENLTYRDSAWKVPSTVSADDPGWFADWSDFFTSTNYALGIEFRAPMDGMYNLEAIINGGDTGVRNEDTEFSRSLGDGVLIHVVVNGEIQYSFDSDNWFGPLAADLQERRTQGKDVRKYLNLSAGDTVGLYTFGKSSTAYEEIYPYFVMTRMPQLANKETYSLIYRTDYSGSPFKPVYVPYGGTFAPFALSNFQFGQKADAQNNELIPGRTAWFAPGQSGDVRPRYDDWACIGAGTSGAIGIQFTAPQSGKYDILNIICGGDYLAQPTWGDGTEIYILKNDADLLYYIDLDNWRGDFNNNGGDWQKAGLNVFLRLDLAKDDYVTMYVFGKTNTSYDDIYYQLTVNRIAEETFDQTPVINDPFPMSEGMTVAVGADSNVAGVNDGSRKLTPMKEQGEFNFYYLYAKHENGAPVLSTLKMAGKTDPAYREMYTNLMPMREDILGQPNGLHNAMYFGYTDWGALSGSGMEVDGQYIGFDPAIQFRAPQNGKYEVEICLGGGLRLDNYGEIMDGDGVIWRIYDKDYQQIASFDFTQRATSNAYDGEVYTGTFDLLTGESITLLCDQVASPTNDNAYFSFRVTLKPSQPEPEDPEEPEEPEDPEEPEEPVKPQQPKTGSAVISTNYIGIKKQISVQEYSRNGFQAVFSDVIVELGKEAIPLTGVSNEAKIIVKKYDAAVPQRGSIDVYGEATSGRFLKAFNIAILIEDKGSVKYLTHLNDDAELTFILNDELKKIADGGEEIRLAEMEGANKYIAMDTIYYADKFAVTSPLSKPGIIRVFLAD